MREREKIGKIKHANKMKEKGRPTQPPIEGVVASGEKRCREKKGQ